MNILFAAGGTAGHINPALAAASYIRENYPSSKILFVGTADHMESRLVPNAGFELKTIDISGFRRSFSPSAVVHNVKTVAKIFRSKAQSKAIIREFEPDVCVGFGGYVSGPVLDEAHELGIPICIHEQNAFPGVTNKALAKKAQAVMLTVEDAASRLEASVSPVITGLPVRGELLRADREACRKKLGLDSKPLILSFGGSLGAEPINEAMFDILCKSAESGRYHHIHSVGTNGGAFLERFEKAGFKNGVKGTVEVRKYIDDMDVCMAAADIVICRAGASTLAEIEALGKASILIPSPYVAENHQYHNAMALVKRNAARIVEEKELTAQRLSEVADEMLSNRDELKQIGENAAAMSVRDSVKKIAQVIVSLASAE